MNWEWRALLRSKPLIKEEVTILKVVTSPVGGALHKVASKKRGFSKK
jgi:hypothetical protein